MTANKRESRLRRHIRQMGLAQALRIKTLESLGLKKTIKVCKCGVPFHARTHTHDLVIAEQFLCGRPWEDLAVDSTSAIVDAGANIGASTVYLAKRFPRSQVIAIEPESENFSLLERNRRDFPNVTCVRAALWHEEATLNLFNPSGGTIAFTIAVSPLQNSQTAQTVECVTIDALCRQFGIASIGLLKLDIEGAEREVLENSSEWIDRVSILAVELHDRLVPGCERAFEQATKSFKRFERRDDKSLAFR